MTLNDYQQLAGRTLAGGQDLRLAALGIAGEAGEVCDIIKKNSYHGHELDRDALIKELGDVLWYLAAAATLLDVELAEIGEKNISKLRARYPEGFSSEASINRKD